MSGLNESEAITNDVFVYKLQKSVIVNDKEYKEIKLDFLNLTGNDITAVEFEMTKSGYINVGIAEFNKTYLIYVAARAAKVPVDVILNLSIKDVSLITRETQTFLLEQK